MIKRSWPRRPRLRSLVPLAIIATALVACSPSVVSSSPPAPVATGHPSASPLATATNGAAGATPSSNHATSPDPSRAFDPTGVKLVLRVVVAGLDSPVEVTSAEDGSGRLFVVEQAGRIRLVTDRKLVQRPFLDIVGRIASGGERGLLGLAFHPDFPTDPRLFVDYTDRDGNTVVSSFTLKPGDPDAADPDSEHVLLRVDQPFPNHNGGALAFGTDGLLYIATGDGGSGGDPQGNGQRLDTLLGKILRIDVDIAADKDPPYAIPSDNPYAEGADGARPEIWLTGLRNPWRMRVDKATGNLWIGDVGQARWEEIDVAHPGDGGANYGWNRMEGFHCFQPAVGCDERGLALPVAEYDHDFGCAVIGGVVVRDPDQPALNGAYVFGDACSGSLWVMDPAGDGRREPVLAAQTERAISAIGQGEDGTVYATDLGRGELLEISAGGG